MTKRDKAANMFLIGWALIVGAAIAWYQFFTRAEFDVRLFIIGSVLLFVGMLSAIIGRHKVYDSQPIPTTPVPGPAPLHLIKGESWRAATSLRYLEALKDQAIAIEKMIEAEYKQAVAAHDGIDKSSGRIEYDDRLSTIECAGEKIEELTPQLAALKARIARLFAGDVGFEIRELGQDLKKKQLYKDGLSRQLRELEAACAIRHPTQADVEQCERQRAENRKILLFAIHRCDVELIEQETYLSEVRDFDFQKLWRELGLSGSPNMARADSEHFTRAKANADIISSIPTVGPPKPVLSEEEQNEQMRARKAAVVDRRRKLKTEELGKILNGRPLDQLSPEEQEDFRQTEMMHDDAMRVAREELSKYL